MFTMKKSKRGGRREGAGRKPGEHGAGAVPVTVRVSRQCANRLDDIARSENRTRGAVARDALERLV